MYGSAVGGFLESRTLLRKFLQFSRMEITLGQADFSGIDSIFNLYTIYIK